jgi:hypothetical protein
MNRTTILFLAMIFGLASTSEGATIVISQPSFSSLNDYSPTGFGQSFTATGTYQITSLDFYMSKSTGGSDITVTLHTFDSLTSILGVTVLGSALLRESGISTTAAWTSIQFSSPISVQADSTYAFKIVAKDPGGSTGWNNYGAAASNVYIGGNFLNISTNGTVSKASSDLAFRVSAVPEPSSSLLVLVGLSVTATRRTRRSIQRRATSFFEFGLPSPPWMS